MGQDIQGHSSDSPVEGVGPDLQSRSRKGPVDRLGPSRCRRNPVEPVSSMCSEESPVELVHQDPPDGVPLLDLKRPRPGLLLLRLRLRPGQEDGT